MLLCHPTNSSWNQTYTPPKGGLNENEEIVDAAIRETFEEVGILIDKKLIENLDNPIVIDYLNKKETFKKVYLFTVNIKTLSELNLQSEIIPQKQLQLSEIDWAGFLDKEQLIKKIFPRFNNLINLI
jgi:ADP-ribose pyrophosphatase YjhB (NUDIX family)